MLLRTQKKLPSLATTPFFLKGRIELEWKSSELTKTLTWRSFAVAAAYHFFNSKTGEVLDDSMPLRIWSWPGWNAWWEAWEDREKGIQAITSSTLSPTPYAAVMTSWTEEKNNTLRFNFAGHIEGGMSGGPVVSALNNKILGIIIREWNEDPEVILASSYLDPDSCFDGEDEESQRWLERKRAAVLAQLNLGMGIAIGLKGLKTFLDSKPHKPTSPPVRGRINQ